MKLDRNEVCTTIYQRGGVRVVTWFQGSRDGQYWALDADTGTDAYGETLASALLSLGLKLRGFEVIENRKHHKPLAATAAKQQGGA